ncbi:unnamed protein product [Fusarium graminearum]|uniref:Chromosome 4, complete genome n=2 Tax=Gibberella zeae TaxID=5518 RepID=A0A098DNV7_GIBZE|nr:unnamed protein product [Fusarium graminearum]CAF3621615.1 unnamed protein product [Fusarium graminearum]CAG1962052.1 unnamed protein product [Fusarium graminearum]CAG1991972.1 unnamed protein product [Fusarium graminearum]CEF83505.1 unnamed protein product [Fusarium graminearum]
MSLYGATCCMPSNAQLSVAASTWPGRAAIAHAVHALPLQSSQASDLSTVGNELIAHLIRWEKYSWQACVLIFTLRTLFWGHSIYNAAS